MKSYFKGLAYMIEGLASLKSAEQAGNSQAGAEAIVQSTGRISSFSEKPVLLVRPFNWLVRPTNYQREFPLLNFNWLCRSTKSTQYFYSNTWISVLDWVTGDGSLARLTHKTNHYTSWLECSGALHFPSSSDPTTSASFIVGTTGACHHTLALKIS